MKILFILLAVFLLTPMTTIHAQSDSTMPSGWGKRRQPGAHALIGTDTIIKHSGKASLCIKAPYVDYNKTDGISQFFDARQYRGKWVKISAYIKTEGVFRALLGLGVYGTGDSVLGWAREATYIEETTDWIKYDLVIDVPSDAVYIGLIFTMFGDGTAWIDDCAVTIATKEDRRSTQLINRTRSRNTLAYQLLASPENLDFELF